MAFQKPLSPSFPRPRSKPAIVPLLRHSVDFVSNKHRRGVAPLKTIYSANDGDDGEAALSRFEASEWGSEYPAIGQRWRRAWSEVVPSTPFIRLAGWSAVHSINPERPPPPLSRVVSPYAGAVRILSAPDSGATSTLASLVR